MDADEVWRRVQEFARQRIEDKQPVFTNDKSVRNIIVAMSPAAIERRSDDGTTNSSNVTRGQVARVWAELNGGPPAGSVLYFTYALIAAALPDFVESAVGGLRLRDLNASGVLEASDLRRKPGRTFGHVEGPDGNRIAVGTVFRGRADLSASGVHRPPMAGNLGLGERGCRFYRALRRLRGRRGSR